MSISELVFLDLLAESNMDLEVLEILTDGYNEDISADLSIETFTDFLPVSRAFGENSTTCS